MRPWWPEIIEQRRKLHITEPNYNKLGLTAFCGPRRAVKRVVLAAFLASAAWRLSEAIVAIRLGDPEPLERIGVQEVLPTVLATLVMAMPPGRSAEGVLMRVGTCVQLLVIVLLPRLALSVALGFPVVFLIVELFETRAPRTLQRFVETCLVEPS